MRAPARLENIDDYLLPLLALTLTGFPALISTLGFAMVVQGNLLGLACLICPATLAWAWWFNRHSWEDGTAGLLEIWFKMWLIGAPIGGALGVAFALVKFWTS